jgi:hypothetical protein
MVSEIMRSMTKHTIETRNNITLTRKTLKVAAGCRNPKWHGGFLINDGYRYIWKPDHPHATITGYVLEHHLILEAFLGRFLDKKEVVHHINHNKLDNSLENLKLFSSVGMHSISEHIKRGAKGKFV